MLRETFKDKRIKKQQHLPDLASAVSFPSADKRRVILAVGDFSVTGAGRRAAPEQRKKTEGNIQVRNKSDKDKT